MRAHPPRDAACFDVAVVGAGPAGATVARTLALRGLGACIVERERPPRYKTCGGGLVGRAVALLELDAGIGLEGVVERACHTAELSFLDAGLSFRVERAEPLVLMTMRAALDQRLLEAARSAGAELRAGCELRAIEERADGLTLRTSGGEVHARYAVACDGALGPTARAAGFPALPRAIPALESEIHVAPEDLARFASSARFDFGALPHGYAWVFPKSGHLSVGCLSTRRGARELRRELARYLELLGLTRILAREDHGFIIPIAPRPAPLARGRVLLCGDAAGLADPLTGEGISNAILSALLAADAIAGHLERPALVRRAYLRALEREALSELRRARLLAPLLYGRPAARAALFRRAGRPLCEAMAELIAGRVTYRSLLARPASYLRLAAALIGSHRARGLSAARRWPPAARGR